MTDSRLPLLAFNWELSLASLTLSFLFSYQTVLYLRVRFTPQSSIIGYGNDRGDDSRIFHMVQLLSQRLHGVVPCWGLPSRLGRLDSVFARSISTTFSTRKLNFASIGIKSSFNVDLPRRSVFGRPDGAEGGLTEEVPEREYGDVD